MLEFIRVRVSSQNVYCFEERDDIFSTVQREVLFSADLTGNSPGPRPGEEKPQREVMKKKWERQGSMFF